MLRCEDNSIYTGITTDLERRFKEHNSKNEKCAKYTLNHSVINIEAVWQSQNRSLASKLEYNLKKLTKLQKESIINSNLDLKEILGQQLDCQEYTRIPIKVDT